MHRLSENTVERYECIYVCYRHHSTPTECNTCPIVTFTEEKMRRKLRFFFMNPIEKWQAKRRFPYKFVIQLIKIFLVTAQLCLFAHNNYMHVNYTWDNRVTFSHLFLKGWDSTQEVYNLIMNLDKWSLIPEWY